MQKKPVKVQRRVRIEQQKVNKFGKTHLISNLKA